MLKHRSSSLAALLLAVAMWASGQNTTAHPTPQTEATGSNGTRSSAARPSASRPGGTRRQGTASRDGGTSRSQLPPAPAANSSIGVIGDADGDGTLDRFAKGPGNAALPGVALNLNALGVATGTPIQVRLQQAVDSGHAHNGDTLQGVLTAPLGKVPSGAPVKLTVVAAAAAGQLGSSGVLSLQVISVNGEQVLSQVITAEGKQGATTLADDAPARGTEAVFMADQPITLPAA